MTRAALVVLLLVAACAPLELPDVDLRSPGWSTWTGQAVWQPAGGRPALAGELIVARHTDGAIYVAFTKAALPVLTAQADAAGWRLAFIERERSYGGRGRPPQRIVWFAVADGLNGGDVRGPWRWSVPGPDERTIEHQRSGERLRVLLDP